MSGRRPFVDDASYIKHVNNCIGRALQEKLAEDKAKRLEHQIKIKEGEN
ncbi:MAG TPA: hypothetical protein VFC79_05675 [Tissierellaceae bacterium]|nr:hypothetical protein [Tissierellaceae bacterium]